MILAFILIGAWIHFNSSEGISISLDPGVKAKIVKQNNTPSDSLSDQTIASFDTSFSGKLKHGNYVLITTDSGKFQAISHQFTMGSKPVSLKIQQPYSSTELTSLLKTEQANIDQAFNTKYSTYSLSYGYSYKVQQGQLLDRGEWFGALLVPDNNQYDTLRFVMQKKDGRWLLTTDPPNIVLSSIIYPEVPKDVLDTVNSL